MTLVWPRDMGMVGSGAIKLNMTAQGASGVMA